MNVLGGKTSEAYYYVNSEYDEWLDQVKALTPQGRGGNFALTAVVTPIINKGV